MSHDHGYDYPVIAVRRVVDGDTVDLTLGRDIGFYVTSTASVRFRVMGVDCPEVGKPGAREATTFTTAWVTDAMAQGLRVETHKADSFGRWLAVLYVPAIGTTWTRFLAADLLAAGHAVPYVR